MPTSDTERPEGPPTEIHFPSPDPVELEQQRALEIWAECQSDSKRASPNSKYERYDIPVSLFFHST